MTAEKNNNPQKCRNDRIPRRRPNFPADTKRSSACLMFEHGLGYKSVAKILELSPNTVKEWAKLFKKGQFAPRIAVRQFHWDEQIRERVAQLRRQGKSWRAIAEETGVSVSTCRKWVEAGSQNG